ncbi:MAG: hypothetical protein JJU28_19610 [Cyclobacteriaceae bacterium]|nr:hypothetical protein [Cyclobacteriaceae bacterium]
MIKNALEKNGFIPFGEGVVHYHDNYSLLFSRGKTLFKKTDQDVTKVVSLHNNWLDRLLSGSKLYRRLTRSQIHHVIPAKNQTFIVFASGNVYRINTLSGSTVHLHSIQGSRPLCVSLFQNDIYYGQYISNPDRGPIRLICSRPPYIDWKAVNTFYGIRHIHGVFEDPFTQTLWITTGDKDRESWIHQLSNTTYEPQVSIGGSQKYRAVSLFFTKDYIYYGSDAPDMENYIYRFRRGDSKAEKLVKVGGPVFYGCQVGNYLYFGTVCEPSEVNRTDASELWCSQNGTKWKKVLEIKKDIWPMKLFQYGQFLFPGGPGDGKRLWLSSLATKKDQMIYFKDISE